MENSADPDQLAYSEANWSGSTPFAKSGYIRAQQDKGLMWNGFHTDTDGSKYSLLSLSRLRLSRITSYPEVKVWSLF